MSGVRVLEGIDISPSAIETYSENLKGNVREADIRSMSLDSLPKPIDVVVGSPPCTQFSYANRGGSGDINDGIQDLRAFLSVVRYLKPKFWIMENVPRVSKIIEAETTLGGALAEFADLLDINLIVDFSQFGLPQKRRRCLIGRFPAQLLLAYCEKTPRRTLRDVMCSFGEKFYVDPIYGRRIAAEELTDHVIETSLRPEEVRLNIESKSHHPVYNQMEFPEQLDRPSRTVTATCTRVSRESIIVEDDREEGNFRRLTVRERATLQGFPGDFVFFARSSSAKIRMIGNALPPVVAYYIGCALRGVSPSRIRHPWQRKPITLAERRPSISSIKTVNYKYGKKRRFRAVLPGFRFKSGMRFQLCNSFIKESPKWHVDFKYGTPKDVRGVDLGSDIHMLLTTDQVTLALLEKLDHEGSPLQKRLDNNNPHLFLQRVWLHQEKGIGPFEVVDALGRLGKIAENGINNMHDDLIWERIYSIMKLSFSDGESLICETKLKEKRRQVYSGMIVGSWFNNVLLP